MGFGPRDIVKVLNDLAVSFCPWMVQINPILCVLLEVPRIFIYSLISLFVCKGKFSSSKDFHNLGVDSLNHFFFFSLFRSIWD